MITQRPKGTQDWFGESMHKRSVIEKMARDLAKTYHMKEIITPAFEHTVLFQRGVGDTTDVVQKEMYTFEDKGGRSITLKPEGTAGVIRAYLENNLYAESGPAKLYYVTQAFRYEQPQSGRLRQHHQFGVEFIGSESPL
ncbi:MAG: ATP phosphoribosyltransferase regulatory subunit, partial [Lachnospiraceae bacterium]|nr:ATP phosphoribosyltransferase regulatory subunit [Lachnospiraceae bacterium]